MSSTINPMENENHDLLVSMFENGSGYSLSDAQRKTVMEMVNQLKPGSTVKDFVEQAEVVPLLKDFAGAVRRTFLAGGGYGKCFENHQNDDVWETPALMLWSMRPVPGWETLEHECGGFAISTFRGYVKIVRPAEQTGLLIQAIADEKFCESCTPPDLDWGVEPQHRAAYVEYLRANGLEPGTIELLQQAVYPIKATTEALAIFGIEADDIPLDAELLVLGDNCD